MAYKSYIDTVGAVPPKVTADNLYDHGGFYFRTLFQSLDGWTQSTSGSGTINIYSDYLDLDTGTTADSIVAVYKQPSYPLNALAWDKNRRLRTRLYINNLQTGENDVIWIIAGAFGTYRHIGFKVLAGTLYGTVADGSTENTLNIQTVAEGDELLLEVVLTAGIQAEFFVNGVSQGTLTANLPSGTAYADVIFYPRVHNATTAGSIEIFITEVKFLQEE